jgi:FkbM family methyltransferase
MLRTIKFIWNHPFTKGYRLGGIMNLVKWQVKSRLNKNPIAYQFTQNSKLMVWKGLTGATGNIYCGLHEFEDMAFLLHFLRPGDLFADIGANIGSYTMLASAEIGARTVTIEPLPATFNNLEQNISLNRIGNLVNALNIGIGSKKGVLKFTKAHDTGNHVATGDETDVTEVPIDTLDNLFATEQPVLIKIDVEGFETEVLNGANNTLSSPGLKAIIIELNGAGNRYGFNDDEIHHLLLDRGFKTMRYAPFVHRLTDAPRNLEHNTLYVRDVEFVKQRLNTAPAVYVQNRAV